MLVTHLWKHYLPHPGGVERAMHELARACAARGASVRAVVCAEGPLPTRRAVEGVEVLAVPSFGEVQSVPVAPTYLALPTRRGEVLHLHESFPLGTLAALLRLALGKDAVPLVVTWHFDVVRQRRLKPLHSVLAMRVLRRARAIHVTTDVLARRSLTLAPFLGKVRVLPHLVDIARFSRSPEHPLARRIRDWAAGTPVVLFVGRLVYYKGLQVLLDAVARANDLRLVIVGDGPLRACLHRRASQLGVDSRVLWLGQVTDIDLVGAYSGADVFVLPSTAPTETFGIVQLEAMAARLPVVSTRLGTGVETVNLHGTTGRLVRPGDAGELAEALRYLATDAALRQRLADAAFERSQDFDTPRLIERYLTLYQEAEARE